LHRAGIDHRASGVQAVAPEQQRTGAGLDQRAGAAYVAHPLQGCPVRGVERAVAVHGSRGFRIDVGRAGQTAVVERQRAIAKSVVVRDLHCAGIDDRAAVSVKPGKGQRSRPFFDQRTVAEHSARPVQRRAACHLERTASRIDGRTACARHIRGRVQRAAIELQPGVGRTQVLSRRDDDLALLQLQGASVGIDARQCQRPRTFLGKISAAAQHPRIGTVGLLGKGRYAAAVGLNRRHGAGRIDLQARASPDRHRAARRGRAVVAGDNQFAVVGIDDRGLPRAICAKRPGQRPCRPALDFVDFVEIAYILGQLARSARTFQVQHIGARRPAVQGSRQRRPGLQPDGVVTFAQHHVARNAPTGIVIEGHAPIGSTVAGSAADHDRIAAVGRRLDHAIVVDGVADKVVFKLVPDCRAAGRRYRAVVGDHVGATGKCDGVRRRIRAFSGNARVSANHQRIGMLEFDGVEPGVVVARPARRHGIAHLRIAVQRNGVSRAHADGMRIAGFDPCARSHGNGQIAAARSASHRAGVGVRTARVTGNRAARGLTVGPRRRAMKAQRQNQHGRRHTMTTHSRMTGIGIERLATLRHIFTSQIRNPCYTQATWFSGTTFGDEMTLRSTHAFHKEHRMQTKVSRAMTYEQSPTFPVSGYRIHQIHGSLLPTIDTSALAQPCNRWWP